MTREQFIARYSGETISALLDFCDSHGMEEISCEYYTPEGYDDIVCEDLRSMLYDSSWTECRDFLDNLPSDGYDWYWRGDEWVAYDDRESRDLFDRILQDADYYDAFNDDDDDVEGAEVEQIIVDCENPFLKSSPSEDDLCFSECAEHYENIILCG